VAEPRVRVVFAGAFDGVSTSDADVAGVAVLLAEDALAAGFVDAVRRVRVGAFVVSGLAGVDFSAAGFDAVLRVLLVAVPAVLRVRGDLGPVSLLSSIMNWVPFLLHPIRLCNRFTQQRKKSAPNALLQIY